MFKKILIANRGEIACRVMVTARKMGIATVAVYSEADRFARHVRMADEAICVGEATSAKSYLLGDVIIEAALKTGAEAIHPGYGFLSENPEFVDAVEKAGLVFIGSSANSIRAMGLKDAAKALMADAGVPVVPGYQGEAQDVETLAKEADKIGYPVLIKARAGGGGKGMRLVEERADFAEALGAAQREGQASFGDPHCLIEKYIQKPRHIEVQVFGDQHGNVVHVFERDCSLQRRHQKLVEEAPAPDMGEDMRVAMTDAAVKAAKAIDYHGAGTIEFIVDTSKGLRPDGFWFMEMNTRLQVEHPVSEAISGLDFVELQLRVAAGEPLPVVQEDIALRGHAIEVRICAEDAERGFLPAIGPVDFMKSSADAEFEIAPLRLDSAVEAGDEISPYYDPMIGKLIALGEDRSEALSRLVLGLDQLCLASITTNTAFLRALVLHADFASGDVDTGLIEREYDGLIAEEAMPLSALGLAAIVSGGAEGGGDQLGVDHTPFWRIYGAANAYADLTCEGEVYCVQFSSSDGQNFDIRAGKDATKLRLVGAQDHGLRYECDGAIEAVNYARLGCDVHLWKNGAHRVFAPVDHAASDQDQTGGEKVLAPMPGLLQKLNVTEGDEVQKGDALAMLEAMKMEHVLHATRDGRIAKIHAEEGAQVSDGTLLIELEPKDE